MKIERDDVIEWAAEYTGPKFHALLCDPPYELGFMGKDWDRSGIAFKPETWVALAEHLLPGAFGMAFASSRGWHRLAVAIEDAGLIIHPSIFGWVAGSGFPKATRIVYNRNHAKGNLREDARTTGTTGSNVPQREDDGMPNMRERDVQDSGTASESEKERSRVLQPIMQGQSEPPLVGLLRQREGEAEPKERASLGTESSMEGRRDVQAQQRQLHRTEVRSLSSRVCGDGESGRVRDGASACDGNDVGACAETIGSSTPCRSQHEEQRSNEPDALRDECAAQDIRRARSEKIWSGHRYGRQSLKPALEPIIVFQKPYKGKPVDSIVETGAGALNIDGARIAGDVPQTVHGVSSRQGEVYGKYRDEPEPSIVHPQGRWPANFYVEHHPDCVYKGTKRVSGGNARKDKSGGCKFFLGGDKRSETPWGNSDGKETVADWDCVEECPVRRLGEQSGAERALHPAATGTGFPKSGMFSIGDQDPIKHNDKGTAARFFFNVNRQLDEADPVLYQAKATRKERDAGLGDFAETEGGIKNASGRGYSERDPYAKIKVRNPHPTVKPIDLTRWLATLLLPPTEYAPRRILIPFSGSGSEMIGAHLAGWEQIVGIEMAQEYCEIAEARLKYWTTQPKQLTLIGVNND